MKYKCVVYQLSITIPIPFKFITYQTSRAVCWYQSWVYQHSLTEKVSSLWSRQHCRLPVLESKLQWDEQACLLCSSTDAFSQGSVWSYFGSVLQIVNLRRARQACLHCSGQMHPVRAVACCRNTAADTNSPQGRNEVGPFDVWWWFL